MGCCKSKPSGPSRNKEPLPPSPLPSPPSTEPTVFFKPVPNERSVVCVNARDQVAFRLQAAVPFSFLPRCAIAYSERKKLMYTVGGFTGDKWENATEGDFSEKCMAFSPHVLTGWSIASPGPVAASTLLLVPRGDKEDIYCVGGCQFTASGLVQGTFAVLKDESQQWEALPQNTEGSNCWPVVTFHNNFIYCIGGKRNAEDPILRDEVWIYNLGERSWSNRKTNVKCKVSPDSLAAPISATAVFIFNNQVVVNDPVYTLENEVFRLDKNLDFPGEGASPPIFHSPANFYLFGDNFSVFSFHKTDKQWKPIYQGGISAKVDVSKLQTVKLRSPEYYAFHFSAEDSFSELTEFNVVTKTVTRSKYERVLAEDAGIFLLPETAEVGVAGGRDRKTGQVTAACWAVCPGSDYVRDLPNLPSPQQGLRIVQTPKRLFAIAGFNGRDCSSQEFGNLWNKLPAMPEPVKFPTCCELGGTLYTIGGQKLQEEGVISTAIQALDTQKPAWKKLEFEFPRLLVRGRAVSIPGQNQVLVFGGVNEKNESETACSVFDGKRFQPSKVLEGQVQLVFEDPHCCRDDIIYIYAHKGDCFSLNTRTKQWEDVEEDEGEFTLRI